jgi:hypothetical protein
LGFLLANVVFLVLITLLGNARATAWWSAAARCSLR